MGNFNEEYFKEVFTNLFLNSYSKVFLRNRFLCTVFLNFSIKLNFLNQPEPFVFRESSRQSKKFRWHQKVQAINISQQYC